MPTPLLRTDRLALRAHRPADLEASLALWSDPAVTRFIGGRPSTREEVWSRMLRYAGHWAMLGFGYWAVSLAGAEEGLIGEVGLANFERTIDPPFGDAPEAGWAFAPSVQGRGYAAEAIAAVLAWADAAMEPPRVVCMIDPENAPSLKVARKVGFSEYARTRYGAAETVLFERLR